MSFLNQAVITIIVFLFLLFIVERRYHIGGNFFRKNKKIKLICVIIAYPLLSGVISLFVKNYGSTYLYFALLGVFLYLLNVAIVKTD